MLNPNGGQLSAHAATENADLPQPRRAEAGDGGLGTGAHLAGVLQRLAANPPSRYSIRSLGSVLSVNSLLSIASLNSAGSVLCIGSAGSLLSIGSAGSILSIGSAGSILSIGSAGSILSIGRRGSLLRSRAQPAWQSLGAGLLRDFLGGARQGGQR